MSWWQDFQKAVADGLQAADRSTRAETSQWFSSGATTPADVQAAIDARIAAEDDPAARAGLVEQAADARAQLISILISSGHTGKVDALSTVELARLVGDLQIAGLDGSATPPDSSAMAAAAAAQLAGGSIGIDDRTGGIVIYGDKGQVHEYIAPGADGRPAEIVAGEIMIGSDKGGARPIPEDVRAAIDALRAAGWDPNNPGEGGLTFGKDGDVIATFPDGSTRVWQHDDLRQTLADLEASAGSIRDIGSALDRGATSLGNDALANFNRFLGSLGVPGVDWGTPAGGAGSKTPGAGAGGATGGSTGGADGPGASGSSGRTGPTVGTGGSSDDLDTWTGADTGPSAGGGGSDDDEPDDPDGGEPADEAANEFVERHRQNDNPADGEEGDGWAPSTITPPAGKNWDDTGDDGSDETDDTSDDEDDDDDGSDPDTEYTPAPDGEGRKVPTAEELARLMAAALAGDGRDDRPPIKLPEHDPAFAQRMQDRKLGMIGNPGDPDLEQGTTGGPIPDTVPLPDPDDDTPGHDTDGVDKGEEDRLQGDGGQGPVDPSLLDDAYVAPEPLAPQQIVVAEVDPGLTAPLEVAVTADVNLETPLAVPGYHYALGDPVGPTASAGESGADAGIEDARVIEAITPIAALDRDVRLGGELSIASGFRPASKDVDDEEPDNG